jgi:hypothetical protein
MKIIFEQLGFDYSDVFIQKNGFHYKCGDIKTKNENFYYYRPDSFRINHLLGKRDYHTRRSACWTRGCNCEY